MPFLDDVDADALISRLAGPLLPVDRPAFRRACEAALGKIVCSGPGPAYRAVAELQRQLFNPPADTRAGQPIGIASRRPSKLAAGPPIGADPNGDRVRRRVG